MSLLETSYAIYTRACEIQARLQEAEYRGGVPKGSSLYRFRTGPLRTLIEASEKAVNLGSRRVTVWAEEQHQREI
jgi:hypothetical protein